MYLLLFYLLPKKMNILGENSTVGLPLQEFLATLYQMLSCNPTWGDM